MMAKCQSAAILAIGALLAGVPVEGADQAMAAVSGRVSGIEALDGCADCLEVVARRLNGEPVQVQARALLQRVSLFDRDKREYVGQTGQNQRYGPIFRTKSTHDLYDGDTRVGKPEATGFMISPCLAVVNAHAVYGYSAPPELRSKIDWASGKDFGIRFLISRDAGGSLRPMAEQPVARPIGEGLPNGWVGDFSRDYAIVKFKKGECPGEKPEVGWVDLVTADWKRLVGVRMNMAGFPGDRDRNRLSIERGCTFKGFDETGPAVSHDCGSVPGASGSPIFGEIDGRLKVVAIHVGTNGSIEWKGKAEIVPEDSAAENLATMVGAMATDAYLEAHQDFLDHGITDIPAWAK